MKLQELKYVSPNFFRRKCYVPKAYTQGPKIILGIMGLQPAELMLPFNMRHKCYQNLRVIKYYACMHCKLSGHSARKPRYYQVQCLPKGFFCFLNLKHSAWYKIDKNYPAMYALPFQNLKIETFSNSEQSE